MKERENKREKKRTESLQPVSTQKPKNFMWETSELYINDEELNYYTSRLRDGLQKFLKPAEDYIISLALSVARMQNT